MKDQQFLRPLALLLVFLLWISAAGTASAGLTIVYTANTFGKVNPCPT